MLYTCCDLPGHLEYTLYKQNPFQTFYYNAHSPIVSNNPKQKNDTAFLYRIKNIDYYTTKGINLVWEMAVGGFDFKVCLGNIEKLCLQNGNINCMHKTK